MGTPRGLHVVRNEVAAEIGVGEGAAGEMGDVEPGALREMLVSVGPSSMGRPCRVQNMRRRVSIMRW